MAELLKGLPVAKAIVERLAPEVGILGFTPRLAIVRVGERSDDLAYERGAIKRCGQAGVDVKVFALDPAASQTELLQVIDHINHDPDIHGCLLMRPLPEGFDEAAVCAALDPAKDVDGIGEGSLFGVFAGSPVGFAPCTAQACVELLDHYGIALEGKRVCVVGRSLVIGKPVAMLALGRNATVTVAHSRTTDLPAVTREADVVIAAVGKQGLLGADAFALDAVVVDVGMNWDEQAGRLCGDVAFDEVEPCVRAVTPVPGGVGAVTTAVLAEHVVEAAKRLVGKR